MRLLIDVQALQNPAIFRRGVGRYTRDLIQVLVERFPDTQIKLIQNSQLAPLDERDLFQLELLTFCPPISAFDQMNTLNEHYYGDWLSSQNGDHLLIASPLETDGILPAFIGGRVLKWSAILYDLIPLLFPQRYLSDLHSRELYAHRFRQLMRMDALFSISQATARDMIQLAPQMELMITNIRGGCSDNFSPIGEEASRTIKAYLHSKFGFTNEFIFYVGADDERKNLLGAIEAFGLLPKEIRQTVDLVIACKLSEKTKSRCGEKARTYGVFNQVHLLDYVEDADLLSLYRTCRLLFFPSLYEGLGLPVLEALRCGAPVIVSNNSSLREYADPNAIVFDPSSLTNMVCALEEALSRPRNQTLPERIAFTGQFTWTDTAERLIKGLHTIPSTSNTDRRKIKLVWCCSKLAQDHADTPWFWQFLIRLQEYFDIVVCFPTIGSFPSSFESSLFPIATLDELATHNQLDPHQLVVYQPDISDLESFAESMIPYPGYLLVSENRSNRDPSIRKQIIDYLKPYAIQVMDSKMELSFGSSTNLGLDEIVSEWVEFFQSEWRIRTQNNQFWMEMIQRELLSNRFENRRELLQEWIDLRFEARYRIGLENSNPSNEWTDRAA